MTPHDASLSAVEKQSNKEETTKVPGGLMTPTSMPTGFVEFNKSDSALLPSEGAEYRIDPEFRHLLPCKTAEERNALKESVRREGTRDDLVVWDETNILLDGHDRHDIDVEIGIKWPVARMSFTNWEEAMMWVWKN
jgi:hypothetical protein